MGSLIKIGGTYYGKYREADGKIVRRTTKQRDRVRAQIILFEWEQRVARGLPARPTDEEKRAVAVERERKTRRLRTIYFILDEERDAVKIGISGDPMGRLASLQTGHAGRLRLVGTMPGTRHDEKRLHQRFAGVRLRGEWFRRTPEIAALATGPHKET